jgi:glycosyltransferase involved in cell wall biosynthesis
MKKVSIITVSFNSEATIQDTIVSVLTQDYPCIEYIIIDGASNDGTMDIVRQYHDRIDAIVSEPDLGIYDGMNKGICIATGDVVAILNSDDIYADNTAIRQLIDCMESNDTDTVFADLVIVDPQDTNRILRYYDSSTFHPGRLRYGWMPAHPTFLAKRELYRVWGGYSLDYQIAADYEMMVRLLYSASVSYAYLPKVVVKMRSGGVSTSGLKNSWILNNEIVSACKANNLNTSLLRVLLKFPAKLMEYFKKPKRNIKAHLA